jgi:hypothetical protein
MNSPTKMSLVCLIIATNAMANLLVNGSFELLGPGTPICSTAPDCPLVNWSTTNQLYGWDISVGNLETAPVGLAGLWAAGDGEYRVDMNGVHSPGTVLSQNFSTAPGQAYQLAFDLSETTNRYLHIRFKSTWGR